MIFLTFTLSIFWVRSKCSHLPFSFKQDYSISLRLALEDETRGGLGGGWGNQESTTTESWPYLASFFSPLAQQPPVGQGFFTVKASRSHSDTPHSVGLLWASDQPDVEPSTWQHTTLTRDRHPSPKRDSNPQSRHANGRRPMEWIFWLPLKVKKLK
jgi:hypothetical protein